MEHPVTNDMFVTFVCALVVAFIAAKRYNTPETNRLSTTRLLFRATGAGYVAASLALFFLLCEIVLKPGMLTFLGLEHAKEVAAKFTAPPVLAAVLLTTLLPNVTIISAADAWLLKRFQAWGRIPHGARILADALTPAALPIFDADVAKLRVWINSRGDIPNELEPRVSADAADSSRGSLTRVLMLYRELEMLGSAAAYANAVRERQNVWQRIYAEFRVFTVQTRAFFLLFDQLAPLSGSVGEDVLKEARDRYREVCLDLHRRMVEFLAELLLVVEGTDQRIAQKLRAIGFTMPRDSCAPLPVGPFVFTGTMTIFAILAIIAVVQPPPGRLPVWMIAVLIGTTQTIGLLAAILPKLHWSAFRRDRNGGLPYLGWLGSATFAASLSLLLDRLALAVANQAIAAATDFVHFPLSPMAPMAFIVCLAIAIICEFDLPLAGLARRAAEGMLCGAAMLAAIFICIHLLALPSATAGQAPPWFPFLFSFGLGFVGGFIGPAIYRRARGPDHGAPPVALRVVTERAA